MHNQNIMKRKPTLSFWQIWNMSFGFMGVQIGYSLQNANTSRILSAIGADPHNLSLFWLAAPFAGLFVQPIVGLSSDKLWTRLGRRIPFILGGAIVSALAMFFMPNSEHFAQLFPAVFFGAMMLLFMDVSFNVTMQPFRALVSDMVDDSQRNQGYAVQSFLINVGAVLGSLLPFLLTNVFDVSNEPEAGQKVASTVVWAFYLGGGILLLSVIWTALRTKEYPPEEYAQYNNIEKDEVETKTSLWDLIKNTPLAMKQLAITQFFSWFALFIMWVYSTQGVAENVWGTADAHSKAYNEAGDWVGVIFAAYSVFAALFSLAITPLANKYGRKNIYMLSLILGGLGLVSMSFINDKNLLFIPMVGVGIAWAAILALPYAILSSSLPAKQTGVYMGLFNATITIPQIAAGLLGGVLLSIVGGKAIGMLVIAGVSMVLAGLCAKLFITDKG